MCGLMGFFIIRLLRLYLLELLMFGSIFLFQFLIKLGN